MLANKYRPKTLNDIVGQGHVARTIESLVSRGVENINNGYIFHGRHGTGKTTMARIFSKSLNCEKPSDCKECNVCNSLDYVVQEIDAARYNGVDSIKEILSNLKHVLVIGKVRVLIIDEAHNLTPRAFDAMLKSLESNNTNSIFIFCTTEYSKIPDTIKSRCISFQFREASSSDIYDLLAKVCKEESIIYSPSALKLISENSSGSFRDSLNILSALIKNVDDKLVINYDDCCEHLMIAPEELIEDLINSISSYNANNIYNSLSDLYENVGDITSLSYQILAYMNHIVYLTDNYKDYRDDLISIINRISLSLGTISDSPNKKLILEICIFIPISDKI